MIDCILEFEHLYRKMTEYELELLDVILTLKLLNGICITDEERKLALTVCRDLNFGKRKAALKHLLFSSQNTQVNQQQKKQKTTTATTKKLTNEDGKFKKALEK